MGLISQSLLVLALILHGMGFFLLLGLQVQVKFLHLTSGSHFTSKDLLVLLLLCLLYISIPLLFSLCITHHFLPLNLILHPLHLHFIIVFIHLPPIHLIQMTLQCSLLLLHHLLQLCLLLQPLLHYASIPVSAVLLHFSLLIPVFDIFAQMVTVVNKLDIVEYV